ncbi:MAG: hypothetical protein AAGI22_24835 [Planctomycetota bacterium]
MPATLAPRVVLVTRPTELDGLLARHGTLAQASFFLESRGQDVGEAIERQRSFDAALEVAGAGVPLDWRRARVDRADLDRFLFAEGDLVVALGQDGLVANLAKYLDGQPVIGLDPEPGRNAGVLVRHAPADAGELLRAAAEDRVAIEERAMVEARVIAGPRVLALNEVFVGHRSHQSARYEITIGERAERQSSSGLIVTTGTGATGWASSIARERADRVGLPSPTDERLAYFVREAWPGASYGVSLTAGELRGDARLRIVSHMEDGVLFGDGMESDRVSLSWGQPLEVSLARERLRLVVG